MNVSQSHISTQFVNCKLGFRKVKPFTNDVIHECIRHIMSSIFVGSMLSLVVGGVEESREKHQERRGELRSRHPIDKVEFVESL